MNTSTDSDNDTADPDPWPNPRAPSVNAALTFLLVLIALTALIGNMLVILAVFLYHRLKDEVSNLFIVNLCITDLSSAAVVMASSAAAVGADRWVMAEAWCSTVCGANYCFIIVSMLTLCFISLDRYVAIHHSLRYHHFVTRRRILLLLLYAWLQGFAFGLAPILSGWVRYDYWEATCAIQWHLHGHSVLTYVIVAFILCFLLPGVILIVAYCKVLKTTKKITPRPRPVVQLVSLEYQHCQNRPFPNQNGTRPNQNGPSPNHYGTTLSQNGEPPCRNGSSPRPPDLARWTQLRRTKYSESSKAVRSLLIVMLAYFLCMTPFSVTKLYKVIVPVPDALPGYANLLATFFQFLGSAVNPFIYGLFRRDFQKAFLYLLWRTVRYRHSDSTFHPTSSGSF